MSDVAADRIESGRAIWPLVGVALLLVSTVAAVSLGASDLSPAEVVGTVLHRLNLGPAVTSELRAAIVWELRLPRVLTAGAVGAGLALSGTIMQAATRNPLADPYLLGLSSGASLGAVVVLVAGVGVLLPAAAFAGSLLALFATLSLASALGPVTPARTVLSGVAVSALGAALTSFVIFWAAQGDSYREILSWLMGSLGGARWLEARIALGALALIGLPLLLVGRLLDAFAFGDTAAAALGVRVGRTRWLLLGCGALVTGAMVSVSGSIGFIGLVVPHAVRLLAGSQHRRLLPLSALTGAIVLIWADTMARTAFGPREMPVGIITALVGAPVFAAVLWLTRRSS